MAETSDHPLQHNLAFDKALAFGILMQHGRGVTAKSPKYVMEKLKGLDECRKQYEVASFLDPFGQHIYYGYRDKWFKEDHGDTWPFDAGPSEGAGLHKPSNVGSTPSPATILPEGSCSSPTNEGEKQKVLRYIPCDEGHGSSQYCYIQDDGTHLQRDSCTCGFFESVDCVLDLHRYHAGLGFTGESRLYV